MRCSIPFGPGFTWLHCSHGGGCGSASPGTKSVSSSCRVASLQAMVFMFGVYLSGYSCMSRFWGRVWIYSSLPSVGKPPMVVVTVQGAPMYRLLDLYSAFGKPVADSFDLGRKEKLCKTWGFAENQSQ